MDGGHGADDPLSAIAGHERWYPSWRRIVGISAAFGLALAGLTGLSLLWRFGWMQGSQIALLAALFGVGGAVALAISTAIGWWLIPNAAAAWRTGMIAALTLLAALALTGVLLTLDYRSYYGQWHARVFSRPWLWQQIYTTAAAIYQYAVVGPRIYGIAGIVLLIATSWWAGRPIR